jgi:pyruvate kinase
MRRAKIVCTIGPASRAPETIDRLVADGMDVARLNFSHGTHQQHAAALDAVRNSAARRGRAVAVLQDLAGAKIRCGEIAGGSVPLESGATVTLTPRAVLGSAREIPVNDPDLSARVRPGDPVLLADGELELSVVESRGADLVCRVVVGGVLSSHKGLNLPSRSIDAPSLTEKDREDLAFGLALGVDYVALSFVRSARNVLEARHFAKERGASVPWIAKIEKHEALDGIDGILEAADGIMVARGDLGVETPLEHVPALQKLLIAKANRAGKPVITATQMLRSMVENPRPTRAEVSDVANAILDGTDAVMLSEETATGRYPVEAARMLARIAEDAERAPRSSSPALDADQRVGLPDAIADAACRLAEDIGAAAIIASTHSGTTPRLVARFRPRRPILAPTAVEDTYRRLALVWGVVPLKISEPASEGSLAEALARARDSGFLRAGDSVVIAGRPPGSAPGPANSIRVLVVDEDRR